MKQRDNTEIIKHHRTSDVYKRGRYLHVNMKISTQSRRGRAIARETATEILNAIGSNETAFDMIQRNAEALRKGEAVVKKEGSSIRVI